MNESKSKTAGFSIAAIVLIIVIGFGFIIGLTQTNAANKLKDTKTEISNYQFDENGALLAYTGQLKDLVIPETYSFSPTVEEVQMSSTSIYTLIDRATRLNIKTYKIENLTGYQQDEYGNQYYQERYVLIYTKREVVEGNDYTVKEISSQAFNNNQNITSIVMPNTVKSIGSNAFAGCSNLQSVTFSDNLERIENAAFFNCQRLTNVVLPDTVSYIGIQAFQDCDAIKEINIPSSLTEISNMVFQNCDGITSITIPSNVQYISSDAFYYCRNLKTINFEEGVSYIGSYAFYGCRALQTITLPSTITYIGDHAFYSCTNLRTVIVKSYNVPNLEANAFYTSALNKIYVLDELFDEYLYTSYWSNYSSRIVRMSTLTT